MGGPGSGRYPAFDPEKYAITLEEWSKKDDSLALCQYCVEQDIYPDVIYALRDRSDNFATVLKRTKMRIADRIRKQLHNKDKPYNYGLFMAEIGFHDQFYHDYQEGVKDNDAKRKKEIEAKKSSVINVYTNSALASGLDLPASSLPDTSDPSAE